MIDKMKPIVIITIAFVLFVPPLSFASELCEVSEFTPVKDYDLLYDLVLNGLNEVNLDTSQILVDDYKNTSQYESECNSLWKEYTQLGQESKTWKNSCMDSGKFPNSEHVVDMYHTMNGVCRVATLIPIEQSINESEINCGKGTVDVNGQCVVDTTKSSKGGGCLIATATYGSELAPEVQKLRELRDNQLLSTTSGTHFMNTFNSFYYSFSPIIADYERENPLFKEMVKLFITPMITSLSILNYVEMDSEGEVLGYGISLIILNVMMYVGVPVLAVMRFRK